MSLYTDKEICGAGHETGPCRYATMHECGNCLKECAIGYEDRRSRMDGSCPGYVERGA